MDLHLPQRHLPLRFRNGDMNREVRTQAMTVLQQQVRPETQQGILAPGLPIKHILRIGGAPVRSYATLFPVEVDRRMAAVFVLGRLHLGRLDAVLADEALQAGPRTRSMPKTVKFSSLIQPSWQGAFLDLGEEEPSHLSREDVLVIVSKDATIGAPLTERPVRELKPEQVIAELFAEELFAEDAVKGGEQAGLEQLSGRDAGAAFFRAEIVEQRRVFLEHNIQAAFDGAQGMVCQHGGVEVKDGEEVGLCLRPAAQNFQTSLISTCSNH